MRVRSEDSSKDYPAFAFRLGKTWEKPNQVIKSKGLMPRTRHRPSGTPEANYAKDFCLRRPVLNSRTANSIFKVCHGSLYAVTWLVDEPREFNLPTLPQRCITYLPEKLPSKYGVHSEEYLPIRTVTPVVAEMTQGSKLKKCNIIVVVCERAFEKSINFIRIWKYVFYVDEKRDGKIGALRADITAGGSRLRGPRFLHPGSLYQHGLGGRRAGGLLTRSLDPDSRDPTREGTRWPAGLQVRGDRTNTAEETETKSSLLFANLGGLCDCKWKSGKESATCVNARLTEIPKGLDAGTQILNLTGNKLGTIEKDAFEEAKLLNLQKVYLSKCRIKTLDRHAFRLLINLVELDLSHNSLSAVPSHVFDSVPELRELKLSGNPIQRILNDAFIGVPTLVRLELSECLLGTVEARAFSGLENTLEWLKLDKNKLVNVKSSTLIAMQNLHGLELAENPWNCTCELRPLREWMLRQNIPYDVPPVCTHPPRLKDKAWDKLDLDEFACKPNITASEAVTTGVEGRNVTMSCNIGGIPEPRVKWLWRNRVIANLSGVPYSNGRKMYMVHVTEYASNLTISTADMQDAGMYVCTAENKAGKVEAQVTLSVLRRPPDTGLSGRVLVASIIVAALFVLASCLIVLCVCSVRRRQQGGGSGRWQGQAQSGMTRGGRRRDDSYEKIEMNHKGPSMLNHAGGCAGRGGLPKSGNNVLPPGQNAEVAVVGPMMMKQRTRHGEYRGVPSVDTDLGEDDAEEDEEGGYEDEVETPTPTTVVSSTRDGKMSWSGPRSSDDTPSSHRTSDASEVRSSAMSDNADLHIPRCSGGYLDNR
ncbi:hypothetical protein ANN_22050 [Periplaneta americana]|uniref:Ig-like domain-containing protein n=1 Tax=Periplaneta americana TaxID=6978 RepID=A0ABQ8S7U8_PERAM|nr:hypothetical protein ANN_22050 [Periplaneta americana]